MQFMMYFHSHHLCEVFICFTINKVQEDTKTLTIVEDWEFVTRAFKTSNLWGTGISDII